jgi:hypothetical protein
MLDQELVPPQNFSSDFVNQYTPAAERFAYSLRLRPANWAVRMNIKEKELREKKCGSY